ncbi:LacI family DNA-binding transcriptional regulator [Micromonospora cathayae]|uniref:LacI family DNA-binding transcriptional regulator n=1 Tax=Micromonospora cathayae TaxID=3028804 RepID=A0ABY7ZM88_9ACTN|nr:LacI family DNA-binding transcriptional regulator [Micromonospora sp. HUAS 3]WDZ83613.1 LacI family DNA-binding transcriptional regulator [Micromonospora sp. HUAS 3]
MTERGGPRRVRMRDVAVAAGVSASTVANVLSRPDIVAPETRLRVEQAIRRTGFVRSGPARQLRGLPSPIVGSVVLDLANPYFAALNRGVEDRLAEAGCLLLTASTDLRPEKEGQLLDLLQEQAVRGIVIAPIGSDRGALLAASRRGTPVVLVDEPRSGLDLCAAAVDDVLGGRLAAEHLLALGHRRIAYLGATVESGTVTRRRAGVRQAVADAGLDPDDTVVDLRMVLHPPALVDAAAGAVDHLLALRPAPTAVLCLNDTAALGVLRRLHALGRRVPEDVSVVGYDDLPFAALLSPPLTTVRQPTYALGRTAAGLLLDEARPDHTHRQVLFRPELMVRSSTAPPPGEPAADPPPPTARRERR